jgi:hypothetical protein
MTQLRRHASPTAFLYTHPTNTTSPGDSIDPTDPVSRLLHDYSDSGADDYNLTSTYEGTADTIAVSAKVHTTAEPVTFRLPMRPDNNGILLRRTSDQAAGYQSADVRVDGIPVGTWQQNRQNTIHRWLDDTYAIPASETTGKTAVTMTLIPRPGTPQWTATRYSADPLCDSHATG